MISECKMQTLDSSTIKHLLDRLQRIVQKLARSGQDPNEPCLNRAFASLWLRHGPQSWLCLLQQSSEAAVLGFDRSVVVTFLITFSALIKK